MEKSIEEIWKKGFLNNEDLVAPKVNDLYNQKSQLLIDQFERMFRINLIGIATFAVFVLIATLFLSIPLVGMAMTVLFGIVIFIGKRQMDVMQSIDKGLSSYEYLKAFDNWLKEAITDFTKLYRYIYPLFFLSFVFGMWFSGFQEKFLSKLLEHVPDTHLIGGIPTFWLLGVLLIAGLISGLAGVIYRIDMKLVYGRVFKKLEEIIADMEELKG